MALFLCRGEGSNEIHVFVITYTKAKREVLNPNSFLNLILESKLIKYFA
jgi:hypothetical protein